MIENNGGTGECLLGTGVIKMVQIIFGYRVSLYV